MARLAEELPLARNGSRWPAGTAELRLDRGGLDLFDVTAVRRAAPTLTLDLSIPGRYAVP